MSRSSQPDEEAPVNGPVPASSPTLLDVRIDAASARGYSRGPQLQAEFMAAAEHLRQVDGYEDPADPERGRQLRADLVLEGGGVKGIGLAGAVLVLDEAGYSFARVAGTSAGAIAASLVAALSRAGQPMTALRGYLASVDFTNFMPEGKIHHFLDHLGPVAEKAADVAILARKIGLYPGAYLAEWLQPILAGLGVRTFGDLRIDQADDPGMSLPPDRRYRLLVHTSDITRMQLVRLPWNYSWYGLAAEEQEVVAAVRASMSIPFFFEPVTVKAGAANISVPLPGGSSIQQHYDAGTVTWVDGGVLANFPITAFDREDGAPPRWPTIGVKLSALQTSFPATQACDTALSVALGTMHTVLSEWDTNFVDETTAARTIFVDNAGLTATQFDLTKDQQNELFLNGVSAATSFVLGMSKAGGVPRGAEQAARLVTKRRAAAGGGKDPASVQT
jgi:NTE family protein